MIHHGLPFKFKLPELKSDLSVEKATEIMNSLEDNFPPVKRRLLRYSSNCTQSRGSDIQDLEDNSREITRQTFLGYVDKLSLKELELSLGYAAHPKQGLTMAGDFHVRYYRGVFRGKPSVWIDWSAINFIFL